MRACVCVCVCVCACARAPRAIKTAATPWSQSSRLLETVETFYLWNFSMETLWFINIVREQRAITPASWMSETIWKISSYRRTNMTVFDLQASEGPRACWRMLFQNYIGNEGLWWMNEQMNELMNEQTSKWTNDRWMGPWAYWRLSKNLQATLETKYKLLNEWKKTNEKTNKWIN